MDGEFVNFVEAARRLEVSRMLISRRVSSGLLDAFEDPRDRRQRLVRATDLDAMKLLRPLRRKEPAMSAA